MVAAMFLELPLEQLHEQHDVHLAVLVSYSHLLGAQWVLKHQGVVLDFATKWVISLAPKWDKRKTKKYNLYWGLEVSVVYIEFPTSY